MRRAILLLAILSGGCFSKPAPKSYVATCTAVYMDLDSKRVTTIWGSRTEAFVILNLKTPNELYFTVEIRAASKMRFPANKLGELRYHECGDNLYCFDSFAVAH